MKLTLVSLAVVVFVTLLVAVGAERRQAPPMGDSQSRQQQELAKLKKNCINYCRPFKDQCMNELCKPLEAQDQDKFWWCIGGCMEYSGRCIKACIEQTPSNKS